jgi:uncharacterized protein (DUF305 family)
MGHKGDVMRMVDQLQAVVLIAALMATPAFAQQATRARAKTAMSMPAAADKAMMVGMNRMHDDMANVRLTGDADKDFVAMMLPHHLGAIDMAKVELQYGKDPEIRRLAQSVIDSQGKEREAMLAWQARHHVSPAR